MNLSRLKENFQLRNIETSFFETLEEAKMHILCILPLESTVGIGHSATLQKMNMTSSLQERGNIVYDKELGKSKEEKNVLKKKAITADWYITSSNAVSLDGRIVNVDHSGNRAAAIIFGPDNVIIVVGRNKVVATLEEAVKRAKNVAAPKNARRAGYNPPCVELNRCIDCLSKERVCNSLSIIEGQSDKDRIQLFIVNEECGF